MAVRAVFAAAALLAIAIAMLLPVPGARSHETRTSQMPTLEIRRG